jgi:hypothetical protein
VLAGGTRRGRAEPVPPPPPPRVERREAPAPVQAREPAPPPPVEAPRPQAPPPPPPPAPEPEVSAAPSLPTLDARAAGVGWWSAAHKGWTAWKSSGMATAHALRAAMAKHAYLLSVPITRSAEYNEGLAAAYFVLLNHVENASPAFLRNAVEQALQQTGGSTDPSTLGGALYELLVTKGRLRQSYPDFVRDAMVAAIPNPGVWADAVVTEHEESTVITTRVSPAVGEPGEQARELKELTDRLAEHRVTLTLPPLTARFVAVKRGDLREARDITFKLTEGGEASTAAWVLTLRSDQLMSAPPKRCGAQGMLIEGFGKNYSALWLAVFNADPERDKAYEIILALTPQGQTAAAPRRSAFTGRQR